MSRINKILAVVLAVQVVLILVMWRSGGGHKLAKLEPLTDLDAATVTRLEIYDHLESPGDKAPQPAIVLAKKGDGWVLASHYDYPADKTKVSDFLDKLAKMQSRGPVTTRVERHRQLGVAKDHYERKLVVHSGDKALTLYLGTSAGRNKTAVRLEGEDGTHAVTGVTAYAAAATARSWVDAKYFVNPDKPIAEVSVENAAGHFELKKKDGAWKHVAGDAEVVPPAGKELDTSAISSMVNQLGTLYLAEPADPAKKSFEPVATVTFAKEGGDGSHRLRIGETKDDKVLAAIDDKDPVWINKSSLSAFIDLKQDKLYHDPKADAAKAPPGGMPPGMHPGGMPPGGMPPGLHPMPAQ